MKAVSLLLTILTAYGTVVVNSDLSVNNKHTSKKKKTHEKSVKLFLLKTKKIK